MAFMIPEHPVERGQMVIPMIPTHFLAAQLRSPHRKGMNEHSIDSSTIYALTP